MSIRSGRPFFLLGTLGPCLAIHISVARAEEVTRVPVDSLIVQRPAPEPTGALTLEQTLRLVRTHHPRLRAAAWRVRAASAQRSDAGRWPNPSAAFDLENIGGSVGNEVREATATLVQTVPLGGDRGARVESAIAGEQLAGAELSSEEREALTDAADRFLDAWTLQEKVARLIEAERLAERSITAAAERFRAGAGPALEQARAEAVLALRRTERIRASAGLRASRQRLAVSWGSAEASFDSLALSAPRPLAAPDTREIAAQIESHPRQRQVAAERALEEARLRETRAANVPDLELGAGVRHLEFADATTFVVSASIPLPLWGTTRGQVAAAEAERQAANARSTLVRLDLRADLEAAWQSDLAAQESYALVTNELKPRSEEVVRQLTTGYRAGRFSSLEFLEGQKSLLEAELQVVEATAEAWRARLALERLLGRGIENLGKEIGR